MVLEESLYHPTLPLEEQGKGAWNRGARTHVQLDKRARDEKPPLEVPRKLRRTASSKLGSQSEGLWGDIMSGEFDTRPGPEQAARQSKSHAEVKSVVLEPESFVREDVGIHNNSGTLQNGYQWPLKAPPEIYQGYFSAQAFLVYGFPPKNVGTQVSKKD
jgi:DNA replication regulator DPB11